MVISKSTTEREIWTWLHLERLAWQYTSDCHTCQFELIAIIVSVCHLVGIACAAVRRVGSKTTNAYGIGSEQVWLDNLKCSGREYNIDYCKNSGWRVDRCQQHDVVAISCTTGR